MPFKHKNPLILVIISLSSLLFTGCGEPQCSSSPMSGQRRPSYMISIDELASKLGLSVRNAGKPQFELGNANNTVRLFTYSGGRAYVNGTAIGTVGKVTEIGGQTYVPELLIPKIRGYLIPSQPIRLPNIEPYEVPRSFKSGIVVIDPGHGGYQPGTKSVLGHLEKDVNLKIAHKVTGYLRETGVDVVMTRESDVYVALEARAALANREKADLFVSVHCNWNDDRMHRGFTVYRARSASSGSKKAGRLIEKYLSNAGIPSKGLRSGDYRVLVQTKGPAVLVECGFMSNYDEAAMLIDPWYQNKIARAIADGILEYL